MQNNDCRQDFSDRNSEYLLTEDNGDISPETPIIATRSQTSCVLQNDPEVEITYSVVPELLKVAEYCECSATTSRFCREKRDGEMAVFIGSYVPDGSPVSRDDPVLNQPTVTQALINHCECKDYSGDIQEEVQSDRTGGDDERIDLRELTLKSLHLSVSLGEENADDINQSQMFSGCEAGKVCDGNDASGVTGVRLFKSSSFDNHKSKHSSDGCATCAEFQEFMRSYFMADAGVDRGAGGEESSQGLDMNQMLGMMKIKRSQTASTSAEIIAANSLLQSKVSELEKELLYQRNSFLWPPSTTIPSELFKECSRLRWRVFELEKMHRSDSSDVTLTDEDIPSAYEISVDSSEPFSAHSSTRKKGRKIRISINGLQRSSRSRSSPESSLSSSPISPSTTTSASISPSTSTSCSLASPSSPFPSMASTFLSLQSIWNYRLSSIISKREQSAIAEKERLANRFSIRKKLIMRSEDDRISDGNTEDIELKVQVPSDTVEVHQMDCAQEMSRSRRSQDSVLETTQGHQDVDHDRNEEKKEKEEECLESRRLLKVKEKLKRNLRERISRKKSQTEQFEMEIKEIKEKEKKKSDRAYASYVSALMVKVNELILIHDQKERDFSELVGELEGTVCRLGRDLRIARSAAPPEFSALHQRESSEEGDEERNISDGAEYRTTLSTEYGNTHEGEDDRHTLFSTPSQEEKYGFQNGDFQSPTKTDSSYSTDSHDDSDIDCSSKLTTKNLNSRASVDTYISALLCSTSFSSATTSPAISSASASPFDENLYRYEYRACRPAPFSTISTDQSVGPCNS